MSPFFLSRNIQSRRISLYFIFLLFKHFCVVIQNSCIQKTLVLLFLFYFISYTSLCMHKHLKNLILALSTQHNHFHSHTRNTHHFYQKCVQLFEHFYPMAIFSFVLRFFSFIFIFIVCCQVVVCV